MYVSGLPSLNVSQTFYVSVFSPIQAYIFFFETHYTCYYLL